MINAFDIRKQAHKSCEEHGYTMHEDVYVDGYYHGYNTGAEPREKRIKELEQENERIKTKYYELQDTLKKIRLALIKERTANIMNYGKGGVEMFNDLMEILKENE